MKKLTLLLFLIGGCFAVSNAQNASVKGIITDTTNKDHLTNTVISLLHANDSILYKFTRSDKDGKFQLNHLTAGKYVMLVTHNTFADYVDELNLSDTSHLDLGEIKMTLEANLLQEVIVRQRIAAVRMKGDTLEFNADSFKVREGASTEEMLRKLPGIQVDKDGKITAQGEKIEKVLVDGEEFFGDDPTLATRNIPADAIDKVQVFDKKSDQAEFTGIDDGQKTKTLNLKLKADKKKGYFGKIDIGAGPNDRWNNTAMFNRFRAKQKFSVYGIMSSTGKTG
ncbi:MAG: carboxypeptidase regulatory-like domain-containing protein, partial [Ilyomonas sp.]